SGMKLIAFVSNTFLSIMLMTAAVVPGSAFAQSPYLHTTAGFSDQPASDADTLVVRVPSGLDNVTLQTWTQLTVDQLSRAMAAQDFTGAAAQQMELLAPAGLSVDRLVLVGVGQPAALPRHQAETIGAALSVRINGSKA